MEWKRKLARVWRGEEDTKAICQTEKKVLIEKCCQMENLLLMFLCKPSNSCVFINKPISLQTFYFLILSLPAKRVVFRDLKYPRQVRSNSRVDRRSFCSTSNPVADQPNDKLTSFRIIKRTAAIKSKKIILSLFDILQLENLSYLSLVHESFPSE